MRRVVLYIGCLLMLSTVTVASGDGGTTSPFSLGAGARELALGGAAIANPDASTAAFWNPSGLARIDRLSLSGFHMNLYESEVAYQFFGVAVPSLDYGTLGIAVFRLGVSDIEKRNAQNVLMGHLDDNRLRLDIAWGSVLAGYDLGLAVSMEHHSLDDYKATSSPGLNLSIGRDFAPDWAMLEGVSVAAVGKNLLAPEYNLSGETIQYPITARLGVSARFAPSADSDHSVDLSTAMVKTDWVDPRFSAGVEYSFKQLMQVRGGLDRGKWSAGLGLNIGPVGFDYAVIDRDLGKLHMFSLNLSFGTTIFQRRLNRTRERENDFNILMNQRLTKRNKDRVAEIVQSGQGYFADGLLIDAQIAFDRALFLARNSDVDTTEIHDLSRETEAKLLEVNRMHRYRVQLDSAQIHIDNGDYLIARSFAELALKEFPNSEQAQQIVNEAAKIIAESSSREELIQQHLTAADSLLNYGQIKQAKMLVEGLRQIISGDLRVDRALKRVTFEEHRQVASSAFASGRLDLAASALELALTMYPGHQWCLDLKKQIVAESSHQDEDAAGKVIPPKTTLLSGQMKRDVENSYQTAQEDFREGELSQAIEGWEYVERVAPGYQSVREYLVKAYKYIGVEYYSQNQLKEAVSTWRKALQVDPENQEIKRYLVRTETEIRKLSELSYGEE